MKERWLNVDESVAEAEERLEAEGCEFIAVSRDRGHGFEVKFHAPDDLDLGIAAGDEMVIFEE